ncbi:MAG: DoxX family protein [Blastococcus sp.]|nr:DoxX family protein [Blastococcus sp.]
MTATVHPKRTGLRDGAIEVPDTPAGLIQTTGVGADETTSHRWFRILAAVTRISLGWIFLWAFLDKAFALGHGTGVDAETGATDYFGPAAWIHGGSPTEGFLTFGTKGPLADFYTGLAGNAIVDWLFMLALLGVGLALILGIGMRIAAVSGTALLVMMFTAVLPPDNNLFMDDHLIYALVLGMLVLAGAGRTLGFGRQWERLPLVREHSFLK